MRESMEELKMDFGEKEEEEILPLPGFRFHPTDEELIGFYLRRKVEKRILTIDFIKQIDIYKYDPWDLPKADGEKEWYYFSKRGRKYKNSIRPNRVTFSGFWKATGIDKPIYGCGRGDGGRHACIGLKKSLVYYRGFAGKGTKTNWMMHEFRLPPDTTPDDIPQEAEVWTLCRIFIKRASPYKTNTQHDDNFITEEDKPNIRNQFTNLTDLTDSSFSKTNSLDSDQTSRPYNQTGKPTSLPVFYPTVDINFTGFWNNLDGGDFPAAEWDELRSAVEGYTEP